jgi:hypothetical protein
VSELCANRFCRSFYPQKTAYNDLFLKWYWQNLRSEFRCWVAILARGVVGEKFGGANTTCAVPSFAGLVIDICDARKMKLRHEAHRRGCRFQRSWF